MLAKKVVREVMVKTGIGTSEMARKLGKPARLVSDRLGLDKSTNLSTDKMCEFLDVMGYRLVVMPSDEPMKDGWYEVTGSKSDDE